MVDLSHPRLEGEGIPETAEEGRSQLEPPAVECQSIDGIITSARIPGSPANCNVAEPVGGCQPRHLIIKSGGISQSVDYDVLETSNKVFEHTLLVTARSMNQSETAKHPTSSSEHPSDVTNSEILAIEPEAMVCMAGARERIRHTWHESTEANQNLGRTLDLPSNSDEPPAKAVVGIDGIDERLGGKIVQMCEGRGALPGDLEGIGALADQEGKHTERTGKSVGFILTNVDSDVKANFRGADHDSVATIDEGWGPGRPVGGVSNSMARSMPIRAWGSSGIHLQAQQGLIASTSTRAYPGEKAIFNDILDTDGHGATSRYRSGWQGPVNEYAGSVPMRLDSGSDLALATVNSKQLGSVLIAGDIELDSNFSTPAAQLQPVCPPLPTEEGHHDQEDGGQDRPRRRSEEGSTIGIENMITQRGPGRRCGEIEDDGKRGTQPVCKLKIPGSLADTITLQLTAGILAQRLDLDESSLDQAEPDKCARGLQGGMRICVAANVPVATVEGGTHSKTPNIVTDESPGGVDGSSRYIVAKRRKSKRRKGGSPDPTMDRKTSTCTPEHRKSGKRHRAKEGWSTPEVSNTNTDLFRLPTVHRRPVAERYRAAEASRGNQVCTYNNICFFDLVVRRNYTNARYARAPSIGQRRRYTQSKDSG